jgi:hypothetical protein
MTDPIEVGLVLAVGGCRSCSFFWPPVGQPPPYGPYTAYDFRENVPATGDPGSKVWLTGVTRPPSLPVPEVMDGCRKAPIMTIGINPNLTAFSLGPTGAAWSYPSFTSDGGTDEWAKLAWYYRYRSIYQERLALDFVLPHVLPEGRIVAPRAGRVVTAKRLDASSSWSVQVLYDGDAATTTLAVPGKAGDFPYVLLVDVNAHFEAGALLAGRMDVPAGLEVAVEQQSQAYYTRVGTALQQLQNTLRADGHAGAVLRIGEDVCQLDMVACASPHWGPPFLGGSSASEKAIVDQCTRTHAWAVKQLVQTRPAVLFVVSWSSWTMFRGILGAHVVRSPALPEQPADPDFALLRATTDPAAPCHLVLDATIDGVRYAQTIRLVITPHFSYDANFLPQYRCSQPDWTAFEGVHADIVAQLTTAHGFTLVRPDPARPADPVVLQLSPDAAATAASRAWLKQTSADAFAALEARFFDPHAMMSSVLEELYRRKVLAWERDDAGPGHLTRSDGSCRYCVNDRWQFPDECRYGKHLETSPPPGFLERVAAQLISGGPP